LVGTKSPKQPWDNHAKGEIGHVHFEAEGSSHVKLSLADAKEVSEKGWGERHGLSGKMLPWGYVMIYAPRDEEEVKIMSKFFRASIAFMSGGGSIKLPDRYRRLIPLRGNFGN
jgi:hypothetical protein